MVTLMSASLGDTQRLDGLHSLRDALEKRELFCTCEESNHGLSVGRLGRSLEELAVNPVCVH
jgi:hypothetical protein